ncbi:MAG: hypothetical protein OXC28_18445, partial [Defluviicoccus sp.]|nr:hypothetical protein [Defluviicoccus sp.]
ELVLAQLELAAFIADSQTQVQGGSDSHDGPDVVERQQHMHVVERRQDQNVVDRQLSQMSLLDDTLGRATKPLIAAIMAEGSGGQRPMPETTVPETAGGSMH